MRPASPSLPGVRLKGTRGSPSDFIIDPLSDCRAVFWLHLRQGTPYALCPGEGSALRSDIGFAPLPDDGLAPVPSRHPGGEERFGETLSRRLGPTWFQLEPTVHNAIAPASCGSMRSSTLRTSIFSAATPADACGTSRKGKTDHRVKRC